jgi:radical SAM family uncharacterized protein/radical SAM-linked protein
MGPMGNMYKGVDPELLEKALRTVEKPGRYIGGEWNERRKDPDKVKIRVALVFPEVYEIGMSYLGQKILYHLLNARPDVLAERVFAPWPDFEGSLRASGLPLYSLENKIPLRDFDVIGFSLLYELNYSNILTILDLGGIPAVSSGRGEDVPLVIAGGPAVFNPEPIADLFDVLLAGDGEEAFPEILDRFLALKKSGTARPGILRELSAIRGAYVPSLYEAVPTDKSPLLVPSPRDGAPARIRKRVLETFADSPFPAGIIVPGMKAVFDRVAVEAARGCPQNCRFCQAASLYFPHRAKNPEKLVRTVTSSLERTGYEDVSFAALSIGDYPYLEETTAALMGEFESRKISLSLSSLRPGRLSPEMVEQIAKVRKTGLTLVPEAGTERLRRVINKKIGDGEIHDTLQSAFARGWKLIKLYFMVGLPTETGEDLDGIVGLVRDIIGLGQKILGAPPRIHLSVSSFIPKPHTAFQWAAMDDGRLLEEKQEYLRAELRRSKSVEFKKHPVDVSLLEAVFSRGDRRLTGVLRRAWEKGARFDSWGDRFDYSLWREAMAEAGVRPEDYWGALDTSAVLPWDRIETGIRKSRLLEEFRKALAGEASATCRDTDCADCAGCEMAGLKGVGEGRAGIRIEPVTIGPVSLGSPLEAPVRYRVVYSKSGPARFLSHIDLIHVLERAMRRAGVEVAQSQGFHPKMLVSYGPALPLGMTGLNEPMEFRAARSLDEKSFLAAMNSCLPRGILVRSLIRLGPSEPPLSASFSKTVYRLDLDDPAVKSALREAADRLRIVSPGITPVVRRLISDYDTLRPAGVVLKPEPGRKRLEMVLPVLPSKSPRPQDIVREVFGLENSVFALTRAAFIPADRPNP